MCRPRPRYDTRWKNSGWMGSRSNVHVCTNLPDRMRPSQNARSVLPIMFHYPILTPLPGLITGLTQQMIGVGFIVSTWVGYGSSKVPATSSFSWRFPLAFQCIPCLIIICGMLFFPESPRYLVEIDRADDALKVLRKLHYNGSNDDWIQSEFNEIKLTIDAEKAITAPGWKVMFTVPVWRKRLMHATLVQVFTQMTGYVSCQLVD
jgi:MFS family permease